MILTDLSQLQNLSTTLHHREVQTKKQAEAERIAREIAALESNSVPPKTYELTCPGVPMDITRRGGKFVQKRGVIH